jgi:two-component system response regulator CpxR
MVDDDVALTDGLRRLLAMDGFRLDAVHRAEEGLARALENRHALVILDIMLPDGDGRQILRRIRTASEIPIIMLTASSASRPAQTTTCPSPSIRAS